MKIKLLKALETVMPKIIQEDLPIKLAFKLNTLMDEIELHLKNISKFQQGYFEKHGESMPNGKIKIATEKVREFEEGMEELLEEEVDITPIPVPLSILLELNIKVSVIEIESLKLAGFIEDDISSNE